MRGLSSISFIVLPAMAFAFSGSSSFVGSSATVVPRSEATMTMEYIPSGMTKEQWRKVQAKEKQNKGKNLGKVGITSFKSRSFAEWQKAGGKNLFPVDPKSVKDPKDLPYMQRPGGSPDDGDLKVQNFFSNVFGGKKAPEPEPEPEKKTNWWTL